MIRTAFTLGVALCVASLAFSQSTAGKIPRNHTETGRKAIAAWIDGHLPEMLTIYRHLHANPELSLQEFKTASLVAKALVKAGFKVTRGVGGTGVAGVLKNGEGPTLLIRGDMDALPLVEQTGVPYASKVTFKNADGVTVGAMHACGHDVHTTMVIGVGQLLADLRDQWKGTIALVAQPAEEVGKGARMMIADGLFDLFPKPDFCLSLHVSHKLPAGEIGYTSGWCAANVDSVDVTVFGKGGHGARPNDCIDPILVSAHIITSLQSLVSRRVNPIEPAVVTVGSIHGGTKHNIIPSEVKMQLTVRSYSDEVRNLLLDGIREIATAQCTAFRCPQPPKVEVKDEYTPASYNDPALTTAAVDLFTSLFGDGKVKSKPAEMGGEDFGTFARKLQVPGLQYGLGSIASETYSASLKPGAEPLPSLHSPFYVPDPEPTLEAAIRSMGNLALSLLDVR